MFFLEKVNFVEIQNIPYELGLGVGDVNRIKLSGDEVKISKISLRTTCSQRKKREHYKTFQTVNIYPNHHPLRRGMVESILHPHI